MVVSNILGWILLFKYPALFVVSFASSIGIPLPAGSSTMAAAAFSSQGYFSIWLVMLLTFVGNFLGDLTAYGIVRQFGIAILKRFKIGLRVLESKVLREAESVENSFKATVIISSRFQDQATTIVNIIAGLGRINFKRFLVYAAIGDVLQVLLYSSIGYFFAGSWQAFYGTLGVFSWFIVSGTMVIAFFISRKILQRILKE